MKTKSLLDYCSQYLYAYAQFLEYKERARKGRALARANALESAILDYPPCGTFPAPNKTDIVSILQGVARASR